jgi:glutamate/tyrosine decarboxylase-like PLP-dependent enzyme
VELARDFAGWVESDDRFEVVAPVHLSLVCFRLRSGDEANERRHVEHAWDIIRSCADAPGEAKRET